jgi:hypothetical protein
MYIVHVNGQVHRPVTAMYESDRKRNSRQMVIIVNWILNQFRMRK